MTETLIEARGLSAGYGKMAVVRDLDLHVDAGEVVALIGANGAGKTTTLLTLAGELSPLEGEVRFLGAPTRAPMHVRCRNGLGYVTEERSVIMDMSVADNLRAGRGVRLRSPSSYFPALERIMDRRAGLCSGGEQQMLSLARALGRNPKVLLADELSLGLAPIIVTNLLKAVRAAADERGVGVLLVEQHVRQALDDRRSRVRDGARPHRAERHRRRSHGPARQDRGRLPRGEQLMADVDPGPQDPLPTTPRPAPSSMRRTWNVDITFPDGLSAPPVADVRGRDLRVDADGEGDVVDELNARLEIDTTNTIVAIDASPATTTRLEGVKGVAIRGGFGRELRERMADEAARPSLYFCVLEDLGGAYVISGYAHLEAGVFEQTREMADLAAATQADVCVGWAATGELVGNIRAEGRTPVRIGPVAPDISGDAFSWHEMADLGSTTVRRRRRTDVVAPVGVEGFARNNISAIRISAVMSRR